MAAEEASFKTSMDSIISGLMSDNKFVPVIGEVKEFNGTPSTTHNGLEKRLSNSMSKELYPRMVIAAPPPPGAPEIFVISIPATLPCNKVAIFGEGIPSKSSPFTVDIAPVISRRVVVP